MFNPPRPSLPLVNSNCSEDMASDDLVLTLCSEHSSLMVAHDGFLIGSHPRCDLTLKDSLIQPVHCVIHMQAGAIWIESTDEDHTFIINDRSCCRMALRQGDLIRIGASAFQIDLSVNSRKCLLSPADRDVVAEDLTSLSAVELCDRIVTEQSMIQELSEGDRSGWEALIHAIEAVHQEPRPAGTVAEQTISPGSEHHGFLGLIGQIEELQETIADRTRELTDREATVAASSSMLEQSQALVTQRLDEILEQLGKSESPKELRASA
jgi:hypothetical protein